MNLERRETGPSVQGPGLSALALPDSWITNLCYSSFSLPAGGNTPRQPYCLPMAEILRRQSPCP
jgi:hypothetical protein